MTLHNDIIIIFNLLKDYNKYIFSFSFNQSVKNLKTKYLNNNRIKRK